MENLPHKGELKPFDVFVCPIRPERKVVLLRVTLSGIAYYRDISSTKQPDPGMCMREEFFRSHYKRIGYMQLVEE